MQPDKQIYRLLQTGARVFSCAAGRVGVVTKVAPCGIFPVEIETTSGKLCCTTFNVGDKIRIKKIRKDHYRIENDARAGIGKYLYELIH